jgi:hypothetical protein
MDEILMTDKQIEAEVDFEDQCGINTLLQNLFYYKDKVNVFMLVNEKDEICGYAIRDKKTNEECQL